MYKCKLCNKKYRHKHGTSTKIFCSKCYSKFYRTRIKKKCVDIKGGKCQKCGYNKSLRALTFHHINQSDKLFEISDNFYGKWEETEKELEKCILLCFNCHIKLHSQDGEINNDM